MVWFGLVGNGNPIRVMQWGMVVYNERHHGLICGVKERGLRDNKNLNLKKEKLPKSFFFGVFYNN